MGRLTVSVSDASLQWLREQAEARATSVDAVVEEIVEHSRQNETAREGMRAFLAQEPAVMRDPLTRLPSREDRHDRSVLHR